ncbi:tyrosyl-DNA phosphodiesterase 2 [Alosa sapidissima]|uniref:tyrosyl-DNA phosphodiesterase 2 n=1 Tax=Alosa sapidissima TaxID=34773 RepID=UPI001C08E073|nr:tyrosyl-DNA phosphodiesterase 2 [Alosa sapidissima]
MASAATDVPAAADFLEETRLQLCDEFASITGTDGAVAQCYLAENDWDMERSVNSYFEADMESAFDVQFVEETRKENASTEAKRKTSVDSENNPETSKKRLKTENTDCIDLTSEEPSSSGGAVPASAESKTHTQPAEEPEADGKLSLLTWNVDGLDTLNLGERARGLCSYLALYTPDVVFLQELVPMYIQYIKKRAVSYTIIEGGEEGYFTGVMLKKSRVKFLKSEVIPYPMTQMMRNLLVVQVNFQGQDLCLMTSHFESCKNQSVERMNQLKLMFQKMRNVPEKTTVIFGGDTNLRDAEVAKVGGLPVGVCDVWESLGKEEHCRYTWDTKANSNKSVPYVSRCRFDRVYLRPARLGPKMAAERMLLVGQEKLDCGRYASDHWGIYCTFHS